MPPSNRSSHGAGAISSGGGTIQSTSFKRSINDELCAKELEEIRRALPSSTHAERHRFLTDRRGDTQAAIVKLKNYLEWRGRHCDDTLRHLDSWTYATRMALRGAKTTKEGETGNDGNDVEVVPRPELPCTLFLMEHVQSKQSTAGDDATGDDDTTTIETKKYLQHLPARIDTKLADTSVYALALAIYLDHALGRDSTEKITLVIDVRPGYGWANIKAIHLLPFIQSTVRLLCDLHPMRLERCVIFPVPGVATFLWKAVKPFLGRDTVRKVCLVAGPAGKKDKMPKGLQRFLDEGLMDKLEERRRSCFVR